MVAEKLHVVLFLLGAVGVLAVLAERFKFPFPIFLVFGGVFIGLWPGLPDVKVDPELVFLIFLPPLLFSAAWNFPWDEFRANLTPIFALAVGLVFATIIGVAFAATWLIPGMTLATGFVLGAIVSPPDAVSANAVLKNLRVPRRITTVLEGESLVNDSSGLVAYQFAVAAVVTGTFSLRAASVDFVWMSLGGILLGWFVGIVAERLHRRLKEPAVEITLTIMTPYIAYLTAEKLGLSGVLSVVAAGLYVGHRSWEVLKPESRLHRDAIWKFLDYFLNGTVFILIGLQFPSILRQVEGEGVSLGLVVFYGALISLVVIAIRFLFVFPMSWIDRRFLRRAKDPGEYLGWGGLVVVSWAGMRGVVSLAAALALPLTVAGGEAFPHRHVILCLTFAVIFVTLVLQGLSLPWMARKLKVIEPEDYQTEADARMEMLRDVINEINREIAGGVTPQEKESLELWRGHYEDRLMRIRRRFEMSHNLQAEMLARERAIYPRLMKHARQHLTRMRDEGKISEEVRRKIEYDFDMEEQRLHRVFSQYI